MSMSVYYVPQSSIGVIPDTGCMSIIESDDYAFEWEFDCAVDDLPFYGEHLECD
ncbi:hypothetical protein [Xylella fastidiosa]|uniref:hypothetical protein n=2 Tax=Xylella fastidiosa TaxID=2371 RepID=UPI0018EFFE11|nr:hypothetical protein [Xylella fastidiosa]